MIIEKPGYEYDGFKLGQRVIYGNKERIVIGFVKDSSYSIAINACYHMNISESAYKDNLIVLEGFETSQFLWVSGYDIKVIEQEYETVLEIEYIKVFDEKYVVRISKQNYEVFTRGEFRDNELDIISNRCFAYGGGTLYLNGDRNMADDRLIYLDKVNLDKLIELVEKINNKYGITKTTPEEDYNKLQKVEFKKGENNYFVYFNEEDKNYYVDFYRNYNMTTCGIKHISIEDAKKFCDKWNK